MNVCTNGSTFVCSSLHRIMLLVLPDAMLIDGNYSVYRITGREGEHIMTSCNTTLYPSSVYDMSFQSLGEKGKSFHN